MAVFVTVPRFNAEMNPPIVRMNSDSPINQIPRDQLMVGRTYVGRGRNGNVGLWDGDVFLVLGEKFGQPVVKQEPYFEEEEGCFQPFMMVDEGRVIEPIGRIGWDAHYAKTMTFGGPNT